MAGKAFCELAQSVNLHSTDKNSGLVGRHVMKYEPRNLESTISSLFDDGRLQKVRDVETARASQRKQLEKLLERSKKPAPTQQYLARYDACMRMIEILLLEYGYQLDEQPHASARTIVAALDPSINFRELAHVRHDAKKKSTTPPQGALTELTQLQNFLNNLISDIS